MQIEKKSVTYEPHPGVLRNTGARAYIFREQGILSSYFPGTRDYVSQLSATPRKFRHKVFDVKTLTLPMATSLSK